MRQKGKKRSTLNPRGSKHIGTKDWEGGRATLGEGRREIENLKDDNEKLKTKVIAYKMDKQILIEMIREILGKFPDAADAIDCDKFKNTLKDY